MDAGLLGVSLARRDCVSICWMFTHPPLPVLIPAPTSLLSHAPLCGHGGRRGEQGDRRLRRIAVMWLHGDCISAPDCVSIMTALQDGTPHPVERSALRYSARTGRSGRPQGA